MVVYLLMNDFVELALLAAMHKITKQSVIEVLVAVFYNNRFWINCLLNQQKSSGLLLLDIPRKTGAMNSFHVRINVFTGNTFPGSSLAFPTQLTNGG